MKLNNKFAIGCLVKWYEIEIFEEYFESLKNALKDIDNKENVIVDIFFNMAQNLEQVDEDDISIQDIFNRFIKIRNELQMPLFCSSMIIDVEDTSFVLVSEFHCLGILS